MDTNTLLIVHYSDLICIHQGKISPLHNNSNGTKDNNMHSLNHSLATSVCPMFFKKKLIFKMQNNFLIIF
jgi:hypothetical protein